MDDGRSALAIDLMARFAERTGLVGDGAPRRYLWTDAFAVCNLLGLARTPGGARLGELALRLVDQVHHALGRHRPDDARTGWLSGAPGEEGEAHPTRGGLRIGKPLPERRPGEPADPRLEWERDGQYFHYLTRWMHALDQVCRATGQPTFNRWARELAGAAHRAFTVPGGRSGPPRMRWKMSIDLSRPLVASMGQHDPIDGLVTCAQLDATAAALGEDAAGPDLGGAAADFAAMLDPGALPTTDPLGLGGLLVDACRMAQLTRQAVIPGGAKLVADALEAARIGLSAYLARSELGGPAGERLAFRELGLAIGLAAVGLLGRAPAQAPEDRLHAARTARAIEALSRVAPLRERIESFWLRPESRRAATWTEHADISEVMLATSLAPDGYLVLSPVPRRLPAG